MTIEDEDICKNMSKTKGFGWRVSLTIIMSVGWLIFLILWLFFYALSFNVYQNIAIFLVSILVLGGVVGAAWAPWGIKYGNRFNKYPNKKREKNIKENKKDIVKEIDEELEKKKK